MVPKGSNDEEAKRWQLVYETKLLEALEGFALPPMNGTLPPADRVVLADEYVGKFITRVFAALKGSVGDQTVSKKFRRSWFDTEVRKAIDVRRQLYETYKAQPSAPAWEAYRSARKFSRDLVKKKKREDWEKFLEGIKEDYGKNIKRCWANVKRLLPSSAKASAAPIRMKNGKLATSSAQRKDAVADYREELGKALHNPTFDSRFYHDTQAEMEALGYASAHEQDTHLDGTITNEETTNAVSKAKYGKACGKDLTRNDMFKCGGETMIQALTNLFNWLRDLEVTPSDWGSAVIVNLYKDGDPADLGNYRGIALISCLGKLYLSIWAERLTTHMEPRMSEEQGGFRPKRSTTDQILTLNDTLVRRHRAKKTTFLLFVDFRKAFDTVWRNGLWKRMWQVGIRGKAWRIIQAVYSDIRLSTLVDGDHTRFVPAEQGVRQGCPLSPVLFNIFIDELANMLKAKGLGLAFGGTELENRRKLCALLYADDVVLMSDSAQELQSMVTVVHEFCVKWRIEVNTKKSQVMVVNSGAQHTEHKWAFGETQLEVVSQYKYLGIVFSSDLTWSHHVEKVVSQGRANLTRLRILLSRKEIPADLKLTIWGAVAGSALMYGAETWSTNSSQTNALESIQHQAGVRILRVNGKTSKSATRAMLGLTSLETRRFVAKLRYRGKLLQMHESRLCKLAFDAPIEASQLSHQAQKPFKALTGEIIRACPELRASYDTLYEREKDWFNRTSDDAEEQDQRKAVLASARAKWLSAIEKWSLKREVSNLINQVSKESSQCRLTARALCGATALRPLPVALGTMGQNLIRRRLMAGSAAVNSLMAKVSGGKRSPACHCGHPSETIEHLMLACPAYDRLRREARAKVELECTCEPKGSCMAAADGLDALGQCVFQLGGPADNLSPCPEANRALDELARSIYKLRGEILEKALGVLAGKKKTKPSQRRKKGLRDIRSLFQVSTQPPCVPAHSPTHLHSPPHPHPSRKIQDGEQQADTGERQAQPNSQGPPRHTIAARQPPGAEVETYVRKDPLS